MNNYFLKIWSIPIILGLLTIAGLLTALIGAEVWHFVSWALLAIPLIVMIKFLLKIKARNTR